MSFELWVAGKILAEKRRHLAVSVVGLFSILGVMAGVTALIVVLSVMNGFADDLKQRILGVMAHVTVTKRGSEMRFDQAIAGKLKEIPHVTAASPFVMREVIIQGPMRAAGALVKGIDERTAEEVLHLDRLVRGTELDSLRPIASNEVPAIILGRGLMNMLGCGIGDVVTVVSALGSLTPWGKLPKWKKFRVTGFLDSGYWEFDSRMALVDLTVAQKMFEIPGMLTGIELRVDDPYRARKVRERIESGLLGDEYVAQDWMQKNRNLLFALAMEKRAMFVILTCIVAVAALLIISILMMMVMEKKKDIAILKALGSTTSQVMRIFVWQGSMLGSLGCILGCVVGVVISMNVNPLLSLLESVVGIRFFPSDVYYISELPSRLSIWDVMVIVTVTIAISVFSSIYPAWRAARLDPIAGIRNA